MLKNTLEWENMSGFDDSKPKEIKHWLINFMQQLILKYPTCIFDT